MKRTKMGMWVILAVALGLVMTELNGEDTNIIWSQVGVGGGGAFTAIAIDPTNNNIVYAGTDLAGVGKSTDGGQSFTPICNGLQNLVIQKIVIDPSNTNTVYLGTKGGFYKSTDGGMNWVKKVNGITPSGGSLSYPIKAVAVDPGNSKTLYIGFGYATGNKYVYHKDNYLPYSQGQIYKSTDAGETWTSLTTGITTPAYIFEIAVSPANSNMIFATTEKGFYKSTDAGARWTRKTTGLPYDEVRGLAVNPGNPNIYITSWAPTAANPWNGGVFKSTDVGETWTQQNSQLCHRNDAAGGQYQSNYPDVIIDPQNPNIIYTGDHCYGAYGLQKSIDGGNTWTGLIDYPQLNIEILPFYQFFTSTIAIGNLNQNLLYFGTSMCLWKTTNDGTNWTSAHTQEITTDTWETRGFDNTCLLNVAVDPNNSNNVYFSYADIGLFKSTDCGISFKELAVGWVDNCSVVIDPANSSIVYAAGSPTNAFALSHVSKSTDGGSTWTIISGDANGLPEAGAILAPIVIDTNSSPSNRTIYVGKNNTGVYKSTDGGASWGTINNGLPGNLNIRALVMDPNHSNVLYAGIYSSAGAHGGIFKTINGGANWSQVDNPIMPNVFDLKISPHNSSTIYAGVSYYYKSGDGYYYGGVYVSIDSGATWTKILDNDEISVIAVNPWDETIIYAGENYGTYQDDYSFPSTRGLYRSLDGGLSWELKTGGLPNSNIGMIAIDPNDPKNLYLSAYGSGAFKGVDYAADMFGYWKLDGNCINSAPYGSNGTVHGDPVYDANGAINTSLVFDGNGDYVDCGNYDQIKPKSADFTIECWLKPTQTPTVCSGVLYKGNGDVNKQDGWLLRYYPNGKLFFHMGDGTNNLGGMYLSDSALPLNSWTHVKVVVSRATGYKAYINGIPGNSVSNNTTVNNVNGPNLYIGRDFDATNYYFVGEIDDVKIH